MHRFECCPECGATGQTEGMYCHQCGADVTYEDPEADQRARTRKRLRARVSHFAYAIVATILLAALALVLLYSFGNSAKGATTVAVGLGASLESEELILDIREGCLLLPRWPCRGPLLLSFRYLLSPPTCSLVVQAVAKNEQVIFSKSLPASFLAGEARFRIPTASLGRRPAQLRLLQDKKPILALTVEIVGGGGH